MMTKLELNIRNQVRWAKEAFVFSANIARIHVQEAALLLKSNGHNLPDVVRAELRKEIDDLWSKTS